MICCQGEILTNLFLASVTEVVELTHSGPPPGPPSRVQKKPRGLLRFFCLRFFVCSSRSFLPLGKANSEDSEKRGSRRRKPPQGIFPLHVFLSFIFVQYIDIVDCFLVQTYGFPTRLNLPRRQPAPRPRKVAKSRIQIMSVEASPNQRTHPTLRAHYA